MKGTKFTYFRYHKAHRLPIFIKLDLSCHDAALPALLENMKFEEVTVEQSKFVSDELSANTNGRILTITPAGARSQRQIEMAQISSLHGNESVVAKTGYKVYRHKGLALIVYSYGAKEWECGVTSSFGHVETQVETRTILNRYLSWALAPLGIIGLWSMEAFEGIAVLKLSQSQGEAIFFDVRERRILGMDGVKEFPNPLSFIRLDNIRNGVRMSREELLSFLSLSTGFIDPQGYSIAVRQLLHSLTLMSEGVYQSIEEFSPARDHTL